MMGGGIANLNVLGTGRNTIFLSSKRYWKSPAPYNLCTCTTGITSFLLLESPSFLLYMFLYNLGLRKFKKRRKLSERRQKKQRKQKE